MGSPGTSLPQVICAIGALLNNGAAGSMAPAGRDVGAHLEHLEDIWRRQSVMITMGLIPDVLTSGEKFDIGLGSQRIHRTLLSWFNSGDREAAARTSAWTTAEWTFGQKIGNP